MTDAATQEAGDADVAVIGAGAVGLAIAAALAPRRSVAVIERHRAPGQETSSRNSGVIHAGIYYPPGSLKAKTCVRGRELLYERCATLAIGHRRTGKLIVATRPEETGYLEKLAKNASENGVPLAWLDAAELKRREPCLRAFAALHSPETGIVDAHELVASYARQARASGADLVLHTRVCGLSHTARGWAVETQDADGGLQVLRATWVINAAGLESDRIAALAGIDIDSLGWRIHPNKGDYFTVSTRVPKPATPLVYPVPQHGGLGIHLTVDLGGGWSAGPDANYVDRIGYDVDPAKATLFAESVARYLPDIRPDDLTPNFAGIRPKLFSDGSFRDFVVTDSTAQGAPGMIQLIGVESPGLTAAGALAEHVAAMIG